MQVSTEPELNDTLADNNSDEKEQSFSLASPAPIYTDNVQPLVHDAKVTTTVDQHVLCRMIQFMHLQISVASSDIVHEATSFLDTHVTDTGSQGLFEIATIINYSKHTKGQRMPSFLHLNVLHIKDV